MMKKPVNKIPPIPKMMLSILLLMLLTNCFTARKQQQMYINSIPKSLNGVNSSISAKREVISHMTK
jgi:energy-coupling factor transporter transmembrane protein EcfT